MGSYRQSLAATVFATALLTAGSATGARQSVDAAFSEVRAAFTAGRWDSTLAKIDELRREYPRSAYESSIAFLSAQAAFKLGQLERTTLEAKRILIKFPESEYLGGARWLLAECAVQSEDWDEAERQFNWILGFASDRKLADAARSRIEELRSFLEAQEKYRQLTDQPTATLRAKLALVLPLTGKSSAPESFLQGFKARWDPSSAGDLLIFDSGGDPVRAVHLVQKLALEDRVWGIVGGIDAAETAAMASTADALGTVFLTTECGVEGVAGIGRHVFQGRPDHAVIGARLAEYALNELGLKRFGILAPTTQAGRQLAKGFKIQVIEGGRGEVIAEELYYPETQDFRDQFARVRAIGLRRAFNDSLRTFYEQYGYVFVDSVEFLPSPQSLTRVEPIPGSITPPDSLPRMNLSAELLDSLWEADHRRLRIWMEHSGREIDSLEIPIDVFDGFLFVIEPGMVETAAAQFARANLRTQLLGGENWGEREALHRVKNYIEGMVYAEPLSTEVAGSAYYDWAASVTRLGGKQIDPHHLAGERAAAMMIFATKRARDRESMRLALSQIRDLETFSGNVSLLKEERVDRSVNLMQFRRGAFEPIGR